jgi:16S rRNA (guanine1207-N2)-methyltransferase
MSRWASDPERAADELIARTLDAIDLHGRILLANQAGSLPSLLAARGLATSTWNRRLAGSGKTEPWPTMEPGAGPFDIALLRLPKARDEQEMAAHACLGVLAPGGRLVVYGGNDEGIRSAAGMVERLCGDVDTLATRGHGRVVAAHRPTDSTRLRASLGDWRSTAPLEIGGSPRQWVSYPGMFAAKRIDEGTALLIGVLPPLRKDARVLDYGCGSGVIGASAAAHAPAVALDLLDSDTVALEAARENVPGARILLGASLADAGGVRYDAILSNPPLHTGVAEDHALLQQLIAQASAHLAPRGVLQIVVQRRVPLERLLAAHFSTVAIAAETGSFRVWRANGPHSPSSPTMGRSGESGSRLRHRRP